MPSQGLRCRNGHYSPFETGQPQDICNTCRARLRATHPILTGVLVGLFCCILVSVLELWVLLGALNSALSFELGLVLLAAIPLVFVLTTVLGLVYLRTVYGNASDLGKLVLGTVPVVLIFILLWFVLLIFLALAAVVLSCSSPTC